MTDPPPARPRLAVVYADRNAVGEFSGVSAGPVALDRVSVVACWDNTETRLVLVDRDHPALRPLAARPGPVPAEDVTAAVRGMAPPPPVTPEPGWTARTATGALVAPPVLAPGTGRLPAAAGWTDGDRVPLTLTLTVDNASGGGTVEHHRTGATVSAARAAVDLLRLLAAVAAKSRIASRSLEWALAGQPLALVTLGGADEPSYRRVGAPSTPATVCADHLTAFLWDRRDVRGAVHVLDTTASPLDSARVDVMGVDEVPTGAPLAVLDTLTGRQPAAVPDGTLLMVETGVTDWTPVPGAAVRHGEAGFTVVVSPDAGPGLEHRRVVRLALHSGGHTVVYEVGPHRNVYVALTRLATLTAGVRDLAVRLTIERRSAAAAVAATRERALAWLGRRHVPLDRNAVDEVVNSVLRIRSDSKVLSTMEAALTRVGVEDIEDRHFGAQVVALLVLERELRARFKRDDEKNLDIFADALTAYLVALNQASAETWPWAWQRLVRHVREYLTRKRWPQYRSLSLNQQAVTKAGRSLFERLATRIPWVRWLADAGFDPPQGVAVSPDGLIDLLVLLRPRQEPVVEGARRYSSDMGVRTRPVPQRFTQLYRPVPALDAPLLNQLAAALGPMLNDAGHTARSVQALDLPPALAARVRHRVGRAVEHRTSTDNLLAVRVDEPGSPRALLVNLSPHGWLSARVDDEAIDVAPFAVEQQGAFNYCTAPAPITAETHVYVGERRVSLDAPPVPPADGADVTLPALPADLFRGRDQQLARIRRTIRTRGPHAGTLIFGTRRAGKSALAFRAGQDERLRGFVWLDLSNTPTSVATFGEWSRAVCRMLLRAVRRQLGLTLDTDGTDLIEILEDLDDALDGGPPVVVVLDELDVVLLPEQGSDGRRAAGRLGNLACRNLVLIGTVQRFHRSVHEFKSWQTIECPADLAWADGVTYFFGPVADRTSGPRVEWLRRAGVTPQHFTTEIVPRIGLRPYFWARLRNNLDGHLHHDVSDSRLIGADAVRRHLDLLVGEDPHLNAVIDDGAELEPDERRRRDLFSVDERRILASFAALPAVGKPLRVTEALRVGGQAAIDELVDRAYLRYTDDGTNLRTAVPIYHEFLRSRATDLIAVTPGAASAVRTPALPHAAWSARANATDADVATARAAVLAAMEHQHPMALGFVGSAILAAVPELFETRWAGTGSLTRFLVRYLPDFPLVGPAGNVTVHRPGPTAPPQSDDADVAVEPVTDAHLDAARAAVREALAERCPLPISAAGEVIKREVPALHASRWAGTGGLTLFLARHLSEFPQIPGPKGDAYLERPVDQETGTDA